MSSNKTHYASLLDNKPVMRAVQVEVVRNFRQLEELLCRRLLMLKVLKLTSKTFFFVMFAAVEKDK